MKALCELIFKGTLCHIPYKHKDQERFTHQFPKELPLSPSAFLSQPFGAPILSD